MEKILITGFSGFVSTFFLDHLENNSIQTTVLGIDINKPDLSSKEYKYVRWTFQQINLLEKESLKNLLYQFQPDYILHLASFSSVGFSWKEPVLSFKNNTNIFLNIIDTIRELNLQTRVLSIGSSEEYGNYPKEKLPLQEDYQLFPVSPYGVARVSQEMLSEVYVKGYGLDIIMTRSFNHIGPQQKDIFVIPSFAKQIVNIKQSGKTEGHITTGDVSIIRDFLDVRDVVAAYYLLLKKGKKGEVYNICSGEGTSLEEIIIKMGNIVKVDVNIDINPNFIRPNDNKVIIGSSNKLKEHTGWGQNYTIEQSLKDIIDYWSCKQEVGNHECSQ